MIDEVRPINLHGSKRDSCDAAAGEINLCGSFRPRERHTNASAATSPYARAATTAAAAAAGGGACLAGSGKPSEPRNTRFHLWKGSGSVITCATAGWG